jgi:hypothetical protein
MLGFKNACQCLLALCLLFSITGCKTVDSRVATIRESITSINLGSLWDSEQNAPNTNTTIALTETVEEKEDPTLELLAYDQIQCPNIQIVDDLNVLYEFDDITYPKENEIMSGVTIKDYSSECKNKENNVIVKLNIEFEGELGPASTEQQASIEKASYPYFVAITSSQGGILAKEVFALNLEYNPDSTKSSKIERLDQIIPVFEGTDRTDIEILIGFQLSDTQLAYNRHMGSSISEMLAQSNTLNEIQPAAGTTNLNSQVPTDYQEHRSATQPPLRLDGQSESLNTNTLDSHKNDNKFYE